MKLKWENIENATFTWEVIKKNMVFIFFFHDRLCEERRRTTFVPAHAIHLPRDDWLWPSQQEGSHKSTNVEPVSTQPKLLVRKRDPYFTQSQ